VLEHDSRQFFKKLLEMDEFNCVGDSECSDYSSTSLRADSIWASFSIDDSDRVPGDIENGCVSGPALF